MFFKNAIFYQLRGWEYSPTDLETLLEERKSQNCGKFAVETLGWTQPLRNYGSMFTHVQESFIMICMRKHQKVIDSGAVSEIVEDKIQKIKREENRNVYSKEKLAIKEGVLSELLPDALTKSTYVFAYIDTEAKILCVDSSSYSAAETVVSLLRETVGSLLCLPMCVNDLVSFKLKTWLETNDPPEGVEIGHSATLQSVSDKGAAIAFKGEDDLAGEAETHLSTREVVNLALCWEEAVEFSLTSDLIFKGLKFTEKLLQEVPEDPESFQEAFDGDMSILCKVLTNLYEDMVEIFGGVAEGESKE